MITTGAAATLREQLLRIPDMYALTWLALEPTQGRASGLPTASPVTAALPVREDILSLFGPGARGVHDPDGDQTGPLPVTVLLSSWCQVIAGTPRPNVTAACTTLLDHHGQACSADYASDYAREIGELHHLLRSLSLTDARPLAARCPRCRKKSLRQSPGRGVECCDPNCRRVLRADEYDRHATQEEARIYIAQLNTTAP